MPSLLLFAALAVTANGLSLPARLALIVAAERLPVPVAVKAADVVVEPLAGTIELRKIAHARVVAQRMAASAGQICPQVEAVGTSVMVRCRTKRFEARVGQERGKTFLEIEQLRGLPWRHEADKLEIFYDPEAVGLGGPCPGTLVAGRAECALKDGRFEEATKLFRQALTSAPQASFAGVRLGDLAQANGDVAAALVFYKRSSFGDLFGKVAASRLCELDGNCLETSAARLFSSHDRPEPLKSEMLLRGARAAIFDDRIDDAGKLLAEAVTNRTVGICTEIGQLLCRRMLLVVLTEAKGDEGLRAIETYLSLLDRNRGPLALQMMRAAAEKSAEIGAPGFGANLMAASATAAEGPGLAEHLLRTAELYLAAGDLVRARVVVDYADTRGGRAGFGGPRWAQVRDQVKGANDETPDSSVSAFETMATEGARDLAAAYGAMARARLVKP